MHAARRSSIQTLVLPVLALSACLALTTGCDPADASAKANVSTAQAIDPSTILIDSQHAMTDLTSPSKPYLAEGGAQIIVRPNDFQFRDPKHLARHPNVLRVLYNKSEYAADWNERDASIALNARTLRVVKGRPFEGFKPGGRAVIGVGFEANETGSNKLVFQEFWVASVLFH